MKLSDIQKQWLAIIAQNADPTTINSNGLPTNKEAFGRLCLSLGFPPECFSNPSAGGSYVWGADINTVLNMLSKSGRIAETGTLYPFDQSYANSIGGYPVGARVDAGNGQCHVSTIDNNTTDPSSDPNGNWINPFQAIQNEITNNTASVSGLNNEIQARQNGDNNLQTQITNINNSNYITGHGWLPDQKPVLNLWRMPDGTIGVNTIDLTYTNTIYALTRSSAGVITTNNQNPTNVQPFTVTVSNAGWIAWPTAFSSDDGIVAIFTPHDQGNGHVFAVNYLFNTKPNRYGCSIAISDIRTQDAPSQPVTIDVVAIGQE